MVVIRLSSKLSKKIHVSPDGVSATLEPFEDRYKIDKRVVFQHLIQEHMKRRKQAHPFRNFITVADTGAVTAWKSGSATALTSTLRWTHDSV